MRKKASIVKWVCSLGVVTSWIPSLELKRMGKRWKKRKRRRKGRGKQQ